MNDLALVKFTVLGSGSAIQFQKRASSSYLVEFNNCKILLDCGFNVVARLEEYGVRLDEIDYIFISHKHPDHFMGLIHILFALRNPLYFRKSPMKIFGFKGLKVYFDKFKNIMGKWIEPEIEIIFLEKEKMQFEYFYAEIFKVSHSPEACGLKLIINDKTLIYTGDTDYNEKLKNFFANSHLLVIDCGSSQTNKINGHLSIHEIISLTENANIYRVLLTHFYPDSYYDVISHDIPSNFIIADDLLTVKLN